MLVEHRWSEAKAGKRAPETAHFYAKKAGVLLRLFGEEFRLAELDAPAVDAYVRTWRECTRARREDIDPVSGWVHLRGTKRESRDRRFIVAHPALLSLLRYAAEHAPGQDLLFPPWSNVRRDLLDACKRAGIERCSPNDLRRTYGRWMRIAAFPDEIIAPTMGHADTRMLERV